MYRPLHRFLVRPLLWTLFCLGLLLTFLLGHPTQHFMGNSAVAQTQMPEPLVQQGVSAYQSGDYQQAIALWSQAIPLYPSEAQADRAMVYANLARAQQQIGETQNAIASWEAAAADYQASDNATQYGRMLTEQAQVYISIGQHQRAAALLCGEELAILSDGESAVNCSGGAYSVAQATTDVIGQATALGSLAETYRLTGDYETALVVLETGLDLVETSDELAQYEAPMRNSLGNTHARLAQVKIRRAEASELLGNEKVATRLKAEAGENQQAALEAFASAATLANNQSDLTTELRSQLSLLSLYQQPINSSTGTVEAQTRIAQLIAQLPASRETTYAAISLAKSYRRTGQNFDCSDRNDLQGLERTQKWLEKGLQIAEQIGDERSKSFALGELGHLAECQDNLDKAFRLTEQAQLSATNALESADSLYLWEWQAARLYSKQYEKAKAISLSEQAITLYKQATTLYKQAISTLKSIRTNILTADRDLQFDFRDTVDPIYRQYIELQLAPETNGLATKQLSANETNISEALQTIDALRLAELQNFFGDDCVLVESANARDQLFAQDTQTTVITSVVLPEYTALIANFPDGSSQIVRMSDTQQLEDWAQTFRKVLVDYPKKVFDLSSGEELYKRLIAPLEADLERTNTNTLVFVQDGFLRNIPMSALYDGDQYLIQKYAVATTPALSLTAPRSSSRELRALAVGLSQEITTQSGYEFNDLGAVDKELAAVSDELPGSRTLLNEEFTVERFSEALRENRYSVLHLATHGQFSTVPEETFVITGPNDAGFAEEITFNQLEALIREFAPDNEPIELITLTACETATGDDRSTLGLAGVAIQAGARSAIASLWRLDDRTAASLVPNFYENLRDPNLSKAQALQLAQVAEIEAAPGANPGRWAPLILVGNWQ